MREEIASLTRTGLSAALAGDEKEMPEYPVAVKPKQERAQSAMHALPLMALWVWMSGAL